MENVFKKGSSHERFSWANLGNIKEGRSSLGEEMPVLVYRLMQFTIFDTLVKKYGREQANNIIRESGHLAGMEFARNVLDTSLGFDQFISALQKTLIDLKIGILRLESADMDAKEIILTVGEDLDCSGLPISDETVCDYDEGFISGILECYTGSKYNCKEIDCWANGDRVCRFRCTAIG